MAKRAMVRQKWSRQLGHGASLNKYNLYWSVRKDELHYKSRSTPVAQSAPRNLLTRWDVSSIPANGIFLTKKQNKKKQKMPNGWRTINSLVHKIRLHGRRGKGMAESFSRQKSRHAPQKEGGLKILCDLPPVWPRLVRLTNLMSRMDGKKTHTHYKRFGPSSFDRS